MLRYWPDLCLLLVSEAPEPPEPEPPLMLRERGEGDLRGGPDRHGVITGEGLGLNIFTPHGLLVLICSDLY